MDKLVNFLSPLCPHLQSRSNSVLPLGAPRRSHEMIHVSTQPALQPTVASQETQGVCAVLREKDGGSEQENRCHPGGKERSTLHEQRNRVWEPSLLRLTSSALNSKTVHYFGRLLSRILFKVIKIWLPSFRHCYIPTKHHVCPPTAWSVLTVDGEIAWISPSVPPNSTSSL